MKTLGACLLGLVLVLGPRSGWGCQLPATGQTTCWDSNGAVIPCAGTGQDGELRQGAPLAYADNGDGTVTDVNTGLMWEKLSRDGTVHDDYHQYTRDEAFGHVATLNSMNFAGHNDWRLPNVRELLSIEDYQNTLPTVAPAFNNQCSSGCHVTTCSCTFPEDTWTSTVEFTNPSKQWFVDFQDGQVGTGIEAGAGPARAVRDTFPGCPLPATGQTTCWDGSGNPISCAGTGEDGEFRSGAPLAYADNGDGTVTDLNTGLVWEKLSDDGTVHDKDNLYTWAGAFTGHVATLNAIRFAGHTDWRLPNARELESIVNYQTVNPIVSSAFNTNCAPGCPATTCSCTGLGDYWSSTSSVSVPSRAWFVSFQYGSVDAFSDNGIKSSAGYVRAVRGGGSASTTTTTSTSTTTTTRPPTTSTTTTTTTTTRPPTTSTTTTSTTTTRPPTTSTTSTTTTSTTTSTATSTTVPGSACNNATVIPAGGGTFTATTSGTSTLAGTCGSSGSSPEKVFQWTPSLSGPATLETCGSGTTYDSVLYLRAASCATGAEVQCNDDACANASGLFRASRITPTVTAGTTYYIVVDGFGGSSGSFALRVTPPGAPSSTTSTTLAGAACGSATVIPAGGGTFTGTTSGTSTLAGTCGISGLAPERVFQWTPTTSGTATIQTCGAGTTYDSVLYVRSPTCTSPEVTNGCNDDACPNASGLFRASKVTPVVAAGQTYFIVVDGYSGSSGSFTLSVTPP
jgi:Protein of unknown function (DUF1566)